MILTPHVPGVNFEWISVTLPAAWDAGQFAYAARAPSGIWAHRA
jgi:hypothetical protein